VTADFQNLFQALNPNLSSLSEEAENNSSNQANRNNVIRLPTGASQERVTGILQWVLPPLTEFYNNRIGLLKPALNEMMQKSPLLARNRGGGRPQTAESSTNRRSSVSELLWTNNFLGTHLLQPSLTLDQEIESVSSGNTFISSGLEKPTAAAAAATATAHLIEEEFDPEDLEKIRQNARIAGIGNVDFLFTLTLTLVHLSSLTFCCGHHQAAMISMSLFEKLQQLRKR
jgi:hypothetical protein